MAAGLACAVRPKGFHLSSCIDHEGQWKRSMDKTRGKQKHACDGTDTSKLLS